MSGVGVTIDPENLSDAADQVLELRKRLDPDGPHSATRAAATLALAVAYFDKGELVQAETWALRALQDGPKAAIFGLLGRIAMFKLDVESAIGWFLAAGDHAYVKRIRDEMWSYQPGLHAGYPAGCPNDRHALVLMTAPREPSTLERTIESLRAAGLERWRGPRLLFADGFTPLEPYVLDSFERTAEPVRQSKALYKALISAFDTGADRVTLFEDDIALCRNALDYIDRLIPHQPLTAWHYGGIHPYKSAREPLLAVFPMEKFSRLQGVTLTREAVRWFVEWPAPWPQLHGGDIRLALTLVRKFVHYAVHFPNLVQHTGGLISTVGNPPETRESDTFAGEDFDALSLIF